ncbi:MAG: T9SS type A sorting domain-containing protein [Bacteroidia bacterium]|nr:T9SS type A sorting domain-containing protein [Bacteroidia bacterium]
MISDTFEGEGAALDLLVPASNLAAGQNSLRVVANFKGCSSITLPTSATINYSIKPDLLTTEPFLNVCEGYVAELTAEGAPANGKYVWYNSSKQVIGETSTGIFATDIIRGETVYFVAGATSNGCTGELTQIIVSPEILEIPLLTFERDSLFVTTIGTVQWLLNGQPIAGATNTWYKPTAPGVYTSLVTLGNCSAESDPYEYLVTGVENPDNLVLNLTIYPNPTATDNINVQVTSRTRGNANIELIDMVGKRMFGGSFDVDQLSEGVRIAPVESLPSGVYFVIVNQNGKLVKKKLMIQN